MLNINKYLNKLNITFIIDNDKFIFTLKDGSKKIISKKDMEQYLFICMVDFINEK